jgi:hypothetical protein
MHNAPIELPPAWSFPARAPPWPVLAPLARFFPARPPPPLVLAPLVSWVITVKIFQAP